MREFSKVTIKDVAKRANVSTATVSHVINKTRFVSDKVQRRVHESMLELGYISNNIAKALRGGATKTIGIIIPDITIPYYSSVVYFMEELLHAAGYMLILCDATESFEREKEMIDRLCSYQVDGIILAPVYPDFPYLEYFKLHRIPVVFFDRYPNTTDFSGVFCNVREASAQAIEAMILKGHTRIALINRDSAKYYSVVRERTEGYIDALTRHGISPDPQLIYEIPAIVNISYEVMEELLTKHPDVNGVYGANRNISLGIFKCLLDRHIRVPDDMSVVGFSIHTWYGVTTPKLACVLEPVKEIGQTVARMMLDMLRHPERQPEQVILKATLVGDESI